MAIIQGNAKQGSTRGFYPKVINGSLRFNDDDGAYLSWTPASDGDRQKWTFSFWAKTGDFGTDRNIFTAGPDVDNRLTISFGDTDKLLLQSEISNVRRLVESDMVFRDPSAWYHILVAFDTTQATSSNRIKAYVNGVQISLTSVLGFPDLNDNTYAGSAQIHKIGQRSWTSGSEYDGYLANVHFIDGQALTASDFGETKNGVWVAKDYAGTFGTNGFYLTFEDDTQVEAFNTVLYRSQQPSLGVTGVGFKPDLVITKTRGIASGSTVMDSVRGTSAMLSTASTGAESTTSGKGIISFDSDGFTLGADADIGSSNYSNGYDYVAWCWKAGDSNVSNTDGTITSTVRANDTYGFSIVSYTGNGSNATWGHGLSSAPDMVIVKRRTNGLSNWHVYHSSLAATQIMELSTTAASQTDTPSWNSTAPTNSVVSVGTSNATNMSGESFIAYCWSETTGYSKFGSYTGTGSAGLSITGLGFKPSLLLIKNTSTATNWIMHDSTRDVANPITNNLYANLSNAEETNTTLTRIDFDSDGFTLQNTSPWAESNASGNTYIYAAFADTREAAFWLDQSGNDNDWQPVNLDHNDTVADSPTNNFATWNAVNKTSNLTLADGNLKASFTGLANAATHSTIATPQSGQWYFEFTITTVNTATSQDAGIGFIDVNNPLTSTASQTFSKGIFYRNRGDADSRMVVDGTSIFSGSGYSWATGDVIQIAYDADTGKVWVGKNNSWFDSSGGTTGSPSAGTNPTGTLDTTYQYIPAVRAYSNTLVVTANFGQQPFKYDPPA